MLIIQDYTGFKIIQDLRLEAEIVATEMKKAEPYDSALDV